MIRKILVPLDGSSNSMRGLDFAILIAKQFNASITGLYVLKVPTIFSTKPFKKWMNEVVEGVVNQSESAKKRTEALGVKFKSVSHSEKNVPRYIVNYAEGNSFDLIVMGKRGLGSAMEMFSGSTSNHVVQKSKVPVLIVK